MDINLRLHTFAVPKTKQIKVMEFMSFPIAANDKVAVLEVNKTDNPIKVTVNEILCDRKTMLPAMVVVSFPKSVCEEWYENGNDVRLALVSEIFCNSPYAGSDDDGDLKTNLSYNELEYDSAVAVGKRLKYEIAMSHANALSSLIPNIDGIYHQLVKSVEILQEPKGYINLSNDCGNDSIYGYKFDPDRECMVECVMVGVRVQNGKLQVVGDFLPEELHYTDSDLETDDPEIWEDLRYSDGYDYIPTMMNIIENLNEYITPEELLG